MQNFQAVIAKGPKSYRALEPVLEGFKFKPHSQASYLYTYIFRFLCTYVITTHYGHDVRYTADTPLNNPLFG